ncbi:Fe-S cluster biogenesis protein NfuA, 4Fe-4S-binding domain [Pricia antarctica]|uniref:Fe-S cluster biogenesis protein NfuA, 4Fe-4S-binding domain n=1 Tax=Pricia antarctica TaxID=641691 RepID=A0A1G7AH67_9FLAO|nr:NifU family protein [Pricia antarctica]SDE13226.1 Fe-S cluster biogenesis protein NfuA, 4Fe-4S-binding domain [Pricia antarctica]
MKEYNITVVKTNNPNILKFETNHFLTTGKNYEFKNIDDAKKSPLAQQLFYLPFIKTVYVSGNFIGLERFDIVEWDDVKDEVAQQLVEYLNSGEPVVLEEAAEQKVAVTVYAEVTPNPAVMKFVANKAIVPTAFEFKNIDEAQKSGLAKQLFHFPFVKEIFIDLNYISISKYDMAEWEDITSELREFIRNYLADGKEVVSEEAVPQASEVKNSPAPEMVELDDTSQQIVNILEEYVKPAVASDGGNILFKSYESESKTVNVILQGACSGCPSSTFTLKNGIETMLKNMMGDKVNEVVALNG